MIEASEQNELLALLAWWREAGVDVAVAAEPIDWTTRGDSGPGATFVWPSREGAGAGAPRDSVDRPVARAPEGGARQAVPSRMQQARPAPPVAAALPPALAPRAGSSAAPAAPRTFTPVAPDAATMAAREAARKAATLDALEATLRAFDGCSLKATAKNLCFYRGTPNAAVMVIGEAPGRDEDLAGKPFVGPSGKLLDKMLAAIGLGEAQVHITNTVYWRPPGNRPPTPQETLICRPFLERQIALVAPAVILTLGGPAAKAVLGLDEGIMKLRGKWRTVEIADRSVQVMPTLHPAYLLRNPLSKRQAWRDLLAVKAALASQPRGR